MNLTKTEHFGFAGKEYELCLFSDGWDFTVKAFQNGKPANGYSYSVKLPTAFDLRTAQGSDAIKMLFDHAKSDIQQNNWKQHVEDYICSLNLKEDDGLGCRKCTSRNVEVRMVDGRKIYRCSDCLNIWYGERASTGGYACIVDDITDEVEQKGYSEVFTVVLLNTIFKEEEGRGPSFQDMLRNWCNQNYLKCEVFQKEDQQGKVRQAIRFLR